MRKKPEVREAIADLLRERPPRRQLPVIYALLDLGATALLRNGVRNVHHLLRALAIEVAALAAAESRGCCGA